MRQQRDVSLYFSLNTVFSQSFVEFKQQNSYLNPNLKNKKDRFFSSLFLLKLIYFYSILTIGRGKAPVKTNTDFQKVGRIRQRELSKASYFHFLKILIIFTPFLRGYLLLQPKLPKYYNILRKNIDFFYKNSIYEVERLRD